MAKAAMAFKNFSHKRKEKIKAKAFSKKRRY